MGRNRGWYLLIGIVIILRLVYAIWQNVPALNQDEAALLLNAKFLTESGVDEWGKHWPTVFASFGDYKLPGYIYGTALIGSVFGFQWWTVRVLSFFAGLVNLGLVHILGRKLFGSQAAGWWAMLLMLLSPWSWHFSSVGFEANVGLMFFLLALLLVLRPRQSWWSLGALVVSMMIGGLTYNSPLLLSPLLLWAWWWSRPSWRKMSWWPMLAVLGAMAAVTYLTWPATQQKQGISLLTDATVLAEYPVYRQQFAGLEQTLLGNQYVYFVQIIFRNLIASFGWEFLVTNGGSNPWHTIPNVGHLNFLVPLLSAVGLGWLVRGLGQERSRKLALLMIGLLFGALAPAIITVDAPHATRSLFFFVMLCVLAGGTWQAMIARLLPARQLVFQILMMALLLLGVAWWWLPTQTYWHEELSANRRWHVGLETALAQIPSDDQTIYIYDPNGVLYTRLALFLDLDYPTFASQVERTQPDTVGLVRVTKLGRYHFVAEQPTREEGWYLQPENGQEWSIIEL